MSNLDRDFRKISVMKKWTYVSIGVFSVHGRFFDLFNYVFSIDNFSENWPCGRPRLFHGINIMRVPYRSKIRFWGTVHGLKSGQRRRFGLAKFSARRRHYGLVVVDFLFQGAEMDKHVLGHIEGLACDLRM